MGLVSPHGLQNVDPNEETDMTHSQREQIIEHLETAIDGFYRDIDFYSTSFGGDADQASIDECQEQIKVLNDRIKRV